MIIALQINSSNGLLSSPNHWKKWGMCPQPAASFLRIIFSMQLKIVSNSVYANCISPLTFHIFLCNIISKIFFFKIVNVWYLCASRTVFFDMSVFVCACLGLEVLKIFKKNLFLIRIWIIYSFKFIDAMFFLWR